MLEHEPTSQPVLPLEVIGDALDRQIPLPPRDQSLEDLCKQIKD